LIGAIKDECELFAAAAGLPPFAGFLIIVCHFHFKCARYW
jgi:hypothetical protein